jgi:hypothetical protein
MFSPENGRAFLSLALWLLFMRKTQAKASDRQCLQRNDKSIRTSPLLDRSWVSARARREKRSARAGRCAGHGARGPGWPRPRAVRGRSRAGRGRFRDEERAKGALTPNATEYHINLVVQLSIHLLLEGLFGSCVRIQDVFDRVCKLWSQKKFKVHLPM